MFNNILKVFTSNFIVAFVGLISSYAFPMLMSLEDYAVYQKFLLYVSYLNMCHLGFAQGLYMKYAGKKYKFLDKSQYKSEIHFLLWITAVFFIPGMFVCVLYGDQTLIYIILAIIPVSLGATFKALYQAWNRFTGFAIVNALPRIVPVFIGIISYAIFGKLRSEVPIIAYLLINYIFVLWFMVEFAFATSGVKHYMVLNTCNIKTLQEGFGIHIGAYVELLFHAIDKQFVNIFYPLYYFSMYSFAMSTQSIMNIFISSLAQPLYLIMLESAQDTKLYDKWKCRLLIFGSYSGVAFFVVKFIIVNILEKYTDSLPAIGICFASFPAIAVINVMYINLYKITRQIKQYIGTMLCMLGLVLVLNTMVIVTNCSFVWISITTLVVYYIWLFYSKYHFSFIIYTVRDYGYILGFFIIYFLTFQMESIFGGILYGIIITLWSLLIYKKIFTDMINKIVRKFDFLK